MTWRLGRSTTIALLLSPVGILLISITRLLIVSNYNVATALTVASSGGYINTLLGTLIPIVPIIIPYLALTLLFLDRAVLGLLAFLAVVFTSPTTISRSNAIAIVKRDGQLLFHSQIVIGLTGLLILVFVFGLLWVHTDDLVRTSSMIVGLALVPFTLVLYPPPTNSSFYAQQLRQPWLPAEIIALATHRNIVGYVLSRADGWFVVLVAKDRTISYIHADQVAGQEVCQLGLTTSGRPLVALISPAAIVPTCPTAVFLGS